MTNPLILHTNKIESASSVAVTSEATGFEKEKAYDHRTGTYWKAGAAGTVYFTIDMGSAVDVDAWGCYGQDLYNNSGSIKLQYSSDNFSADTNDFGAAVTPSDNTPIMKTGTSQNARYWRFEISSTGDASAIASLWIGEYLETNQALAIGFEPLALAQQYFPVDSVTQDAEFVGRTLKKKPIKGSLSFVPVIAESYMRGAWLTLLRAIEVHPFFVIPQPDDYPSEVFYCWTDQKVSNPRYASAMRLQANIPIYAKVS